VGVAAGRRRCGPPLLWCRAPGPPSEQESAGNQQRDTLVPPRGLNVVLANVSPRSRNGSPLGGGSPQLSSLLGT